MVVMGQACISFLRQRRSNGSLPNCKESWMHLVHTNLYLDYEDALTLADDGINEHWELYREKFLKGDFP